tara:strand:- start:14618 stop:14980 length:363 start_codon:yes stop_codon:yes gene_type:complete
MSEKVFKEIEYILVIPLSKNWKKKCSEFVNKHGFLLTLDEWEIFKKHARYNSRSLYVEKVKVSNQTGYIFCEYHNNFIYINKYIKTFWVFRKLNFNKKASFIKNNPDIKTMIDKLISYPL